MKAVVILLVILCCTVHLTAFYGGIRGRSRFPPLKAINTMATRIIAAPEGNIVGKKRMVSATQPGKLHIGNYLAAIRLWADQQQFYDSFFSIADLHAITVKHDPKELREDTLQTAALYMACGLDPKFSKIFVQSQVKGSSEFAWLLNCMVPMNWLQSMTQFKEKSAQHSDVSVGLFDYPVLMAADILLYKADVVPIGLDQQQHINLARSIAHRFYHLYCSENQPVFPVPEPMSTPNGGKIMSLEDANFKMSKSAPNDHSRINLLDPPEVIREKIKRAKTDSKVGMEFYNPERPECTNLLAIYRAVSGCNLETMIHGFDNTPHSIFKPQLAEAIIQHLFPIQERYKDLMSEKGYLLDVLEEGREAAEAAAEVTLKQVKDLMGFLPPKI